MRPAAAACVLLLAAFVVHNLVVAVDNQLELSREGRLHIAPRDIEHAASEHMRSAVRGRVANYYYLAQRLAGKTIRLPPAFASLRWELERVARMRVVLNESPQIIRESERLALNKRMSTRRGWFGALGMQRLYIKLDTTAEEHVLAETENGRDLYIIPRHLYLSHAQANP